MPAAARDHEDAAPRRVVVDDVVARRRVRVPAQPRRRERPVAQPRDRRELLEPAPQVPLRLGRQLQVRHVGVRPRHRDPHRAAARDLSRHGRRHLLRQHRGRRHVDGVEVAVGVPRDLDLSVPRRDDEEARAEVQHHGHVAHLGLLLVRDVQERNGLARGGAEPPQVDEGAGPRARRDDHQLRSQRPPALEPRARHLPLRRVPDQRFHRGVHELHPARLLDLP